MLKSEDHRQDADATCDYLLWIVTVAWADLGFRCLAAAVMLYPVPAWSVILAFSLPLVLVVVTVNIAVPEVCPAGIMI